MNPFSPFSPLHPVFCAAGKLLSVLLPFLFLGAAALVTVSAWDLVMGYIDAETGLFTALETDVTVGLADPLPTILVCGAVVFVLMCVQEIDGK